MLLAIMICITGGSLACTESDTTKAKASSFLLLQVQLRQQQIDSPTAERRSQMQSMGMDVSNLSFQRVFIHLAQPLTPAQLVELQALGTTVHPDSWLPPVGNSPTGFVLADMPVDKLDALAAKDYVVSLDTAERQATPQRDVSGPQSTSVPQSR